MKSWQPTTTLSKLVQYSEKHQKGQPRTFLVCPETPKHRTAIVKASGWRHPARRPTCSLTKAQNKAYRGGRLTHCQTIWAVAPIQAETRDAVGEYEADNKKQQSRQQLAHPGKPSVDHSCSDKIVTSQARSATAQPWPPIPIGSESASGEQAQAERAACRTAGFTAFLCLLSFESFSLLVHFLISHALLAHAGRD